MFCQACGAVVADDAAACGTCGVAQPPAPGVVAQPPAPGGVARDVGDHIRASSRDAASVLKKLLGNPVGGLAPAFESLGRERALSAGIAMGVAASLAASWGLVQGVQQLPWIFSALGAIPHALSGWLVLSLRMSTLPAALAITSMLIRSIIGARASFAADVFVAGAAVTPLGAALLAAGLLGYANLEVIGLLVYFALALLALMLFAGFTRIAGMSERAGAFAVPVAIPVAFWLCKVILLANI